MRAGSAFTCKHREARRLTERQKCYSRPFPSRCLRRTFARARDSEPALGFAPTLPTLPTLSPLA